MEVPSWLKAVGFVLVLVALILAALCWRCAGRGAVGGDVYDYDDEANEDWVGGGAFRLKVSDPEYTALLEGKKTVEARPDRPPFARLKAGDPVVVVRARPQGDTSEYPGGRYKYDATVARVDKYPSIEALLKGETLAKVYPGHTAASAAERFAMYLPQGTGPKDPVLAIELKAGAAKPARKK